MRIKIKKNVLVLWCLMPFALFDSLYLRNSYVKSVNLRATS